MNHTKRLLAGIAALLAAAGAWAVPIGTSLDGEIDFRDAIYGPCDFQGSCTVDNVTVVADPGDPGIYWDGVDGFGVRGGQETDEIDGISEETLTVMFADPISAAGVWYTDLFSGGGDPTENASATVFLFGGGMLEFLTAGVDPMGTSNGEVFLDFGGALLIESIVFGTPSQVNDDHSVAGIVLAEEIPEPATLVLLGAGLLAAGLRRRRRA